MLRKITSRIFVVNNKAPNANTVRTVRILLLMLLIGFVSLLIINLHWRLPWMDPAVGIVIAALLGEWRLLESGRVQTSIFLIALTLLGLATAGSIFGLGVHDIAIIMYPVIVIIASLLLERRLIIIMTAAAIGMVGLLALSERFSIVYPSLSIHGDPGEFGVVILVVIISSVVAIINSEQNRRNLDQVHYQSLHDYLTGLPNRILLQDRLEQIIIRQKREPAYRYAVLFIDLDGFKNINDTLGHHQGDLMIIAAGQRIQKILRQTDTIARLGGDEFILLLPDLHTVTEAEVVAERVQAEIKAPFLLSEEQVSISASIGIAFGDAYERVDDLFIDADLAMYRAKALGKAQYQVFEPSMRAGRARNKPASKESLTVG